MLTMRMIAAALLIAFVSISVTYAVNSSYEQSVANVLKSEGGYTNDAADPGGPTNFGITIHDVRRFIKANATAADVRNLTRDQALAIYQAKYWRHLCVRGDILPAGLDYTVFDYGVNAGVDRAGKKLRLALALPQSECRITEGVMSAVGKRDTQTLIRLINTERRRFYAALIAARPAMGVFRRGWMARADSVEAISLRMAGGPPQLGAFGEEIETEPAFGPGKAWFR